MYHSTILDWPSLFLDEMEGVKKDDRAVLSALRWFKVWVPLPRGPANSRTTALPTYLPLGHRSTWKERRMQYTEGEREPTRPLEGAEAEARKKESRNPVPQTSSHQGESWIRTQQGHLGIVKGLRSKH